MAEYYFMSQLPSLDGIGEQVPLPITEERFLELCHRFLGKKAQKEIERLTLLPSRFHEESSSALVKAWNEGERNLRLALGKVRAEKMKKSFESENAYLPVELMKAARMAVEMESPMDAERFLNQYRMGVLESLRPMDTFSEDAVFYYGLKLKLLLRIRQFDEISGETAYKEIYNSIMQGDRLEAVQ